MEFVIKKFLTDSRAVLERGDGEIFVSNKWLLELVVNPYCLGITYSEIDEKCKSCLFKEQCASFYEAYRDIPKPPCIGKFDSDDEDCIKCSFLAACLQKTEGKGYLDAEYEEVNKSIAREG